jgi:uncharacterized protein DUF6455
MAMAHPHVLGHSLDLALHALARLPARLMLTIEDWRERSSLANELEALAAHGELDRTLLEAGLSPGDIPRLLKGNSGAARQLPEMMRRVGIDPTRLPITPETRAIEWRCTDCRTWRRCRDWLASSDADHGYLAFCPNGAALEQIRDRHERRPARRDHPAVSGGVLHELDAIRGQIL